MEKIKKYIIVIFIILVILLAVTLVLTSQNKEKQPENTAANETTTEPVEEKKIQMKLVKDRDEFYTIQTIVVGYLNNLYYGEASTLCSKLNPNYVKEFGITESNVVSKIGNLSNKGNEAANESPLSLHLNSMYVTESKNGIKTYFVYGTTRNTKTKAMADFDVMVQADFIGKAYYILPQDYMKKYGYTAITEKTSYETEIKTIEKNKRNIFDIESIDDRTILIDYLAWYRNQLIYQVDASYNLLRAEYRDKRFGSLEEYKKYVSDNKKDLVAMSIQKYQKVEEDGKTKYTLVDTNGNMFAIYETATMQYTIDLDMYTIETKEFLSAYQKASDAKKVTLNINKFIQMINNKDYKSAYNVLDTGFKNNYFKTQAEFETYVKKNFPLRYKDQYLENNVVGDVITQKVKLTDIKQKDTTVIEKTFVMKLGEGTNFVMSFNIE